MADDTERLILEMSANLKAFENTLDRANRAADRRFSVLEKRAAKSAVAVERSFAEMGGGIRNALATIGVGLAVREVGSYADAWTRSANKLSAAGVEADRVLATQERIVELANETRSSYESTADLYSKINRATQELGANELQVARAVETVNKALAAGGATQGERSAAILQLGQGLGSGVLQGDELRSIRENSAVLSKAIADEFGTTVGGLKKLGEEGKLTADRVFQAILRGSAAVDAQFARTTPTIEDSFTILQNAATKYVGQLDAASGASAKLSGFILYVADNLDLLTQAAIIAGTAVGGVLVGRGLAVLAVQGVAAARAVGFTTAALQAMGLRATFATASMASLRAAMAFLGGPIGVAIAATAVGVGAYAAAMAKAAAPSEGLTKTTDALSAAVGDYEAAALAASIATGKDADAARAAVTAKKAAIELERQNARAKLDSAKASLALAQAEQARLGQILTTGGEQGVPASAGIALKALKNEPYLKQLETDAKAAQKALDGAAASIKAVDAILAGGGNLKAPAAAGGGGSGGRPRDLARERAEIAASASLEAARLRNDIDRVRVLERSADLSDQIGRYEATGLSLAESRKRAAADMLLLDEARTIAANKALQAGQAAYALELARIREEFDGIRGLERKQELAGRIVDLQEQGLDLATATSAANRQQLEVDRARADIRTKWLRQTVQEFTLEKARLSGDEARVRSLERELAIRERSRDLQEQGGFSRGQADATARSEQNQLDVAELRGKFRGAFRDGVRAAITGDLGGYFENLAANLGEKVLGKSLDVLADSLLETLAATLPELFDFGADLAGATANATAITSAGAAAGATMGTAIATAGVATGASIATSMTGAGVAAGGTMAAAIVAAGAQAAALMAAAMVADAGAEGAAAAAASAFRGFRASGGPYVTDELGPEGIGSTGGHGVVFSTAAMRGLADLGRLAKQGMIGGGDRPINLEVVNLGEPATARTERMPGGDMRLTLEPLFKQGLDAAGQSGQLERSLRRRPRAKTRG